MYMCHKIKHVRLKVIVCSVIAAAFIHGCKTTVPYELSTKPPVHTGSQSNKLIVLGNELPSRMEMDVETSGDDLNKEIKK